MKTPIDTTYLADAVVLFRYFEAEGEVRQALSVVKKRSGAARADDPRAADGRAAGLHVGAAAPRLPGRPDRACRPIVGTEEPLMGRGDG